MSVVAVGKANFEELVIKSEKKVLLDFWAPWCGPCKMIAPILAQLAEKYEDKLVVGKVNVDEEMELAVKFQIASIPTLLVFEKGNLVAKTMGYMPLSSLEDWLQDEGIL